MDGQHKQRWVGVILLLLLAAMLAPLVFRSPEQVRLSLEMEAPEPPPVADVEADPAIERQRVEQTRKRIDQERAAVRASAERAQEQGTPEGSQKEPPLSGWSVQVASFRDQANARQLEQSLRDAGYNAYWREATGGDGASLYRVFAGPELERDKARALRERIAADEAFALEGLVVPYSP